MKKNNKFNLKDLPSLLPMNINWQEWFKNDYPIDIEIGTGKTHFFFDRAINFPHRNIIGIEWKYEFIHNAQKRIIRENITNALALHGNAWNLVPLLFNQNSISSAIVNFPDPWWKARHKKRLVLNEIFLTALAERIKSDGFILLQTDVQELFEFYTKLINRHNQFILDIGISNIEIEQLTKAKSHREKKCLENGLAIYQGIFKKISNLEDSSIEHC